MRRRNEKKWKRKKRILRQREDEMKEILSKARDIVLPDDMYDPLDNTNYNWKENEKEVCSLGLKLVPTI